MQSDGKQGSPKCFALQPRCSAAPNFRMAELVSAGAVVVACQRCHSFLGQSALPPPHPQPATCLPPLEGSVQAACMSGHSSFLGPGRRLPHWQVCWLPSADTAFLGKGMLGKGRG